ncbi:MAG: MFS transporter [Acidimicrobiales bacterium]
MHSRDWRYFLQWSVAINAFRLPIAMTPLGFLLATSGTHGYAAGGLVVTAAIVGEIAAVVLSSVMARRGWHDIGLGITTWFSVLTATVAALAVLLELPIGVIALSAFALGCTGAMGLGGYRGLLAAVIAPEGVERAFTYDSILNEVNFLLGPIIVALVAAVFGARYVLFSLVVSGLIALITTATLVVRTPRIAAPSGQPTSRDATLDPPLRARLWLWIASGTEGALEGIVVVIAPVLLSRAHHSATLAGPFLGVLAGGSLIGGLIYARIQRRYRLPAPITRFQIFLLALAILLGVLGLVHGTVTRFLVVTLFGLFIAPTNSVRAIGVTETSSRALQPLRFAILYGTYSVGWAGSSALFAFGINRVTPNFLLLVVAGIGALVAISLRLGRLPIEGVATEQ